MYNISLGSAILPSLLMISSMAIGMPMQHQAFAQNSTMAMNLAKLLVNDTIQALNHKDINSALEHLRLIGQQFPQAFAQNSTMAMNLAKLLVNDAIQKLGSGNSTSIHTPLKASKVGHLNFVNQSSGVVV